MKTVLAPILLLLSLGSSAQDSSKIIRPVFLHGLAAYDFLKTYGFIFGASVPFHHINREKQYEHNKKKNFERDKFLLGELGVYRQPFVYTAITAQAGIGIRYIKSGKYFTELSFTQGIMRTVYDGKVYELDPEGFIKERKLFGRTYLTTGLFYSFNWKLDIRKSNLCFIKLKPSFWAQYPYNSFIKLHFSFQAGISYSLKNIIDRSHTKNQS